MSTGTWNDDFTDPYVKTIKRRHRYELLLKRYVQGIGLGTKRTKGVDTGVPCIIVFVYPKLPESNLMDFEKIPPIIDDVFTDVVEMEPSKPKVRTTPKSMDPLRPKRMRHLFRTACDTAGINELYINAFMGHRNHQGQDYSELSKAKLELEYLRVEPFLTVYGEVEESLEIKEDVKKLERRILDLNRTVEELENTLQVKVEEITRQLFEKWMDEYTEELEQARLDFTKRYKEDTKKKKEKEPSPAPKEKISKIEEPTEEEPSIEP